MSDLGTTPAEVMNLLREQNGELHRRLLAAEDERDALAAVLRKIMDQPDVGIGAQGPLSKTPGRPFLGLAYSTVPLTPAEAAMLKRLATNGGAP